MKIVMLEKNDTDARYRIDETDTCQTLKERMGTGGNNVPILIEVTEKKDELFASENRRVQGIGTGPYDGSQGLQRCNRFNNRGGYDMETIVRRLTPTECERLQGYPDGWTLIGEPEETKNGIEYFYTDQNGKRKKCSDSARYKALGNSICLPFWFYLLRRISAQYERPATLGSLFSGIGGFDLCWTRCNGVGSVRWESEVEDFCTAVLTKHFGDEERGIDGDVREYL